MPVRQKTVYAYLLLWATVACAQVPTELSAVEIRAKSENLEGLAVAGSEGVVSSQRLAALPVLRPGETLEMVPGLIVTQHAGDGKANQYFLRGFNLDHGTDFASYIGGVPINMPTHAHGQGYTDLNFLIPELVDRIRYRKGPYFAEAGDFSSAGAAHIEYFRHLDRALAQLTLGENGYARSLLAGSPQAGPGKLLYALEVFHNDGPWQIAEHYRKLNGVLRYSQGSQNDGWSLSGMAYQGKWLSTDQIPQRAIDDGRLDRFGSLDSSTGGKVFRYSLSGEWAARGQNTQARANAWLLRSGLDLWSNFTYCLDDFANTGTCSHGDQFLQRERRMAGGFATSYQRADRWGRFEILNSIGLQGRQDRINPVGLYKTAGREMMSTTRADRVTQRSLSLWAQSELSWTDWLRTVTGVRGDMYDFTVDANQNANSGAVGDQMVTPKFSVIFGPWRRSELYLNYGHGFHSNDARGATISQTPGATTPVDRVKPLVRTRGYELSLRTELLPGWKATVAAWHLDTASELLFVGDAGTTEASRPSRRHGVEWTNLYVLRDWLALDADFSWSHARFRDPGSEGNHIPGAVTSTANLGVIVDHLGSWFGALRFRYFGPRPLAEDNSVRAKASALSNLRLGYKFDNSTLLALDVFNLFDRKANDIEYWYASQLTGETSAQFDRHIHPAEPRSVRITLQYRY